MGRLGRSTVVHWRLSPTIMEQSNCDRGTDKVHLLKFSALRPPFPTPTQRETKHEYGLRPNPTSSHKAIQESAPPARLGTSQVFRYQFPALTPL